MTDQFDFEALAGGDDRTWRAARLWAQVDPAVAARVAEVDAAYAALAAAIPIDEESHLHPQHPDTSGSRMDALIRRVR